MAKDLQIRCLEILRLNYEYAEDRGRYKAQSFLKMTPNEI